MILAISMRLPSVANLREFWRTTARRKKAQRLSVALAMRCQGVELNRLRLEIDLGRKLKITLVRVAARFLDDDNLASAFKACRDQVAKELGTADGPKGPITWRYEQKKPLRPDATPGIMIIVGGLP